MQPDYEFIIEMLKKMIAFREETIKHCENNKAHYKRSISEIERLAKINKDDERNEERLNYAEVLKERVVDCGQTISEYTSDIDKILKQIVLLAEIGNIKINDKQDND